MTIRGKIRYAVQILLRKETPMLEPGDKAPDFDIVDHRGDQISLDGLRGRKFVLWFFPKADTPG